VDVEKIIRDLAEEVVEAGLKVGRNKGSQ